MRIIACRSVSISAGTLVTRIVQSANANRLWLTYFILVIGEFMILNISMVNYKTKPDERTGFVFSC